MHSALWFAEKINGLLKLWLALQSLRQAMQTSQWLKDWLVVNVQEMQDQFIGKDVQVCIKDVSPDSRKVVLNMQQAASNQVLKSMQVGLFLHHLLLGCCI